jgi:hypothetical protein
MKSKAFIKFLESSTPLIPFLIICHTNSTKFEGVLQLTLTSIGQFLLTKINFSNLFYYNQYLFNLVNMLTLFQFQFENQQSLIFVEPIVNSWDHGFMFPPPFQRALDFFPIHLIFWKYQQILIDKLFHRFIMFIIVSKVSKLQSFFFPRKRNITLW